MHDTILISFDLETTGLDPQRDRIIEIGAVKFQGNEVIERFETLVNPGRSLPGLITDLTGITDAMVRNAPRIEAVIGELGDFIGDAPVVGHNVGFDLDFLSNNDLPLHNAVIDTLPLASILLPATGRYSLTALAHLFGVVLVDSHRALNDAEATWQVLLRLYELALALPLDTLSEIVDQGRRGHVNWGGGWLFEAALQERGGKTRPDRRAIGSLFPPALDLQQWRPLQPKGELMPLDSEALAGLLEPGGSFGERFPSYEHRPQQVAVMRAIADSFSGEEHLLVEAGTGTGKSVAYLLPAIYWAEQNGQRVVVSTNTINLQDQLINKDLPTLQGVFDFDFKVALLKGRSNYICPRRLETLRRRGPRNANEMQLLAKVLVWLPDAVHGERNELTLHGPERFLWAQINADEDGCHSERCASHMNGICPYYRSRRQGEAAHVLVVNHALLMSDIANNNHILPEFDFVVIDEAHHLEAATTDGLSYEATREQIERMLYELGGPKAGVLGQILKASRDSLPENQYQVLVAEVEKLYNAGTQALGHTRLFFQALHTFLAHLNHHDTGYTLQTRLTEKLRDNGYWPEVQIAFENLDHALKPVREGLQRLATGLLELDLYDIEDVETLVGRLNMTRRELTKFADNINELAVDPHADQIYWSAHTPNSDRVSLHIAPLEVGPLLEEHLWSKKKAVVMTSATLTTTGGFEYLRERLNVYQAQELAVESPFDYEHSTLLYLPTDIPEPNDRYGYQMKLEQGLIELCSHTPARTLVLMTSYAQLNQTAKTIRGPLERQGVMVFSQADGTSRHQLLEALKREERAVLLGTRSFWEGVDLPGAALEILVIARLPFSVPSDPIFAARSETFDNSFSEYSIPEAVLRFRQGFGRLIRTHSDFGVVVVLDRRLTSKYYGRKFLDSLPECTRRQGPMSALPGLAKRWLAERRALHESATG